MVEANDKWRENYKHQMSEALHGSGYAAYENLGEGCAVTLVKPTVEFPQWLLTVFYHGNVSSEHHHSERQAWARYRQRLNEMTIRVAADTLVGISSVHLDGQPSRVVHGCPHCGYRHPPDGMCV